MRDGPYQLSNSRLVAEQLRELLVRLEVRGNLPIALQAARWMIEELQRTPMEFGESRDYLPAAEIQLRIAFVQPLYVLFGVHESSGIVFVRKIGWSERRPT